MELFTASALRTLKSDGHTVRLAENHRKSAALATTKVFLSHSHLDRDLVEAARTLLEMHGSNIYVDWADGEMPAVCSAETARKLKAKIRTLKKFVLLASESSLASRWVPWEVGYADPLKGDADIAVLAFTREGRDWTGNEYVGLYPIINANARVVSPGTTLGVPLSTWLAS